MNGNHRLSLPAPYRVESQAADRFNRYRFVLYRDTEQVGRGTHFLGGNHIKPWIEVQPAITFTPEKLEHQALFDALTTALGPGSHVMVHYLGDSVTAEALTADVPPPATPLGFLLWNAGVRWFKDWYFTEGWMEGDQKLQGNLPLTTVVKYEREHDWEETLRTFINSTASYQDCKKRAEHVIAQL